MSSRFALFLWLLKLGAVFNLYLLARSFALPADSVDPRIAVPARIFFAVSAYRCVFPNRYEGNVVLHASLLSSTFVTRTLATFAEVAWIFQAAQVIQLCNVERVGWVELFSRLMVAQILVSQICVWGAILSGRVALYFHEELGWLLIFVLATIASAYLLLAADEPAHGRTLLQLNLAFALVYLPFQVLNLRALRERVRSEPLVPGGLRRALFAYRRATDAESWGGLIGLSWMTGYWATLVPLWLSRVVELAQRG